MAKKTTMKKRTYKKKTGTKKVSLAVKKYVSRTLHTQIENKTSLYTGSVAVTAYNFNSTMQVLSMIPYAGIVQSSTQAGRIGCEIRTRSCYFNFSLSPSSYNASSNPFPTPQEVLIMFGKVKNSRAQVPVSADFAKLWQDGSTSHAPFSTTLDLLQNVNTDFWTVYKIIRCKVGYAIANNSFGSPPTASGANTAAYFYANNDYKLNVCRRINITKYCPKIVKFNDTTSQPTNDGLYMWVMAVPADGSTQIASNAIQMQYTLNYVYEDA